MRLLSSSKKRPIVISFIIVLFLVVASFGMRIKSGKAIGLPFGGRILDVTYCICSANLQITVGAPKGGVFMYEPGASIIDAWYQIFRPGPWVLGSYTPAGACVQLEYYGGDPYCIPHPAMGTISEAGTSM